MPYSQEQLILSRGEPTVRKSLVIERTGAVGSIGRRPPVIVPNHDLRWPCGCRAELGFGSYSLIHDCGQHD
jgi:hypothetical protein